MIRIASFIFGMSADKVRAHEGMLLLCAFIGLVAIVHYVHLIKWFIEGVDDSEI